MAWVYLLIAAACEMVWPIGFKYTNGFREHYGVVAITFGIMGLSLWLVSVAIHYGMHVGSAYAVRGPRDWRTFASNTAANSSRPRTRFSFGNVYRRLSAMRGMKASKT